MSNAFPSLPSLCEYANVPDRVPTPCTLIQRHELLVRWVALCRLDIEEVCLLAGISNDITDALMNFLYESVLITDQWTSTTFEGFRTTLLTQVKVAVQWVQEVQKLGRPLNEVELQRLCYLMEPDWVPESLTKSTWSR